MLDGGYWGQLKEYYETDYDGRVASDKAEGFAKELEMGDATFLNHDRPYDPDEIRTWIEDTEMNYMYNEEEEEEMLEMFPSFYEYENYVDEIASYFMWYHLNVFIKKIEEGNIEFVEEAIRLDWIEMLGKNQNLNDLFLF